ncbi:MAG: Ig-like domain-containing protein, partial [Gammaproteobacteria bacterium]
MSKHKPINQSGDPSKHALRTSESDTGASHWRRGCRLLAASTLLISLVPNFSYAAGGDFAIDFTASGPDSYNHETGGGAFNDGAISKTNGTVESLEGGDFACGDTVTYLAQIVHKGDTTDDPQTLEMQFSFLANTTGQPGAAHADISKVAINYGSVENGGRGGIGTFGLDTGIIDDLGSTATIVDKYFTPSGSTVFGSPAAEELILKVRVDDLESSEEVILRIDAQLTCDPGSNPTGNLQAQFNEGNVVEINGAPTSPDSLGGGEQTIPFKQIGDLAGAGEPLLSISKTVTTEDGICGTDDVDELTVTAGDTVKYCYHLENDGTADLYDLSLSDDNATPGNSGDDFDVVLTGLADLDGQADAGDLASGGTASGEALVTLTSGTWTNIGAATGNNGLSGGNYKELTAEDTAIVNANPAPNQPPVALDDSAITLSNQQVTINATANDSDPDGNLDPTTANTDCASCSLPQNGTLVNNGDGTFSYTPATDFTGQDQFTYEVCDTQGVCDTAVVTITVNAQEPDNVPPVANPDNVETPEDTPIDIDVAANDSDEDGNLDPSTTNVVTGPNHGTLVNNGDGIFTYTPDENYNGPDSFTYEICDSLGECATATVTIDVTPVNDPPIAEDDSATSPEDTPINIAVSANDTDVDGNGTLDLGSITVTNAPDHGEVIVNGDGSVTYTPDANYNGPDSFVYQICDTDGLCDTATVNVEVTPVNDPPVAVDDSASTDEDVPVVINVQDNDNAGPSNEDQTLNTTVVSDPANGTATINADGTVTYTPDPNFTGADTFTYTVCDSDGLCDTATVTVAVAALNDPPVAVDDYVSTDEDTAKLIDAVANDTDVDGNLVPASAEIVSGTENGTLINNGDGTFTYTPDANFHGSDQFSYKVCDDGQPDGIVLCDTADVFITVNPVNDLPVALDDGYLTAQNTTLNVAAVGVLGNDSDVDG